jgi:hypothetical protein
MDITPKDSVETKALNIGQRISTAIGIIIAMGSALLAAFGDVKWMSDNLPLLGTGVGALATGGLTAYVAVRRMRIDRIASKATLILLLLLPVLILTGCAVISGKAGESRYTGFAFGEKASSTLAGLNITETQTAKGQVVTDRGVGIDKAGSDGQADMGKILGNLLLLGLQSQGVPVKAQASAASQADSPESDVAPAASECAVPTDATAAVAYSSDGYGGSPGAAGEGVYGRPSCARCRAYKAAHPDVEIINLDEAANRTAMWSELRKRGFTASNAALPVVITSDAYTMSAK